jgi:mRNA interferase RelE/StbE
MTYDLEFHVEALKEWQKLDHTIRSQFKKQLATRLANPHVPSARLHGPGMANTYKIKLRDLGYRLVYEVQDSRLTVLVLSVGKRDKSLAYRSAHLRSSKKPG